MNTGEGKTHIAHATAAAALLALASLMLATAAIQIGAVGGEPPPRDVMSAARLGDAFVLNLNIGGGMACMMIAALFRTTVAGRAIVAVQPGTNLRRTR